MARSTEKEKQRAEDAKSKAESLLAEAQKRCAEIEEKLAGNTCGFRKTSCADQLAKAVREAYNQQNS